MFGKVKAAAFVICAAAAALVCAPTSASAEEFTRPYAQVKGGWKVLGVFREGVGFQGCRAAKRDNGNRLAIARRESGWKLAVPTGQNGRFAGGVLNIDKRKFDAQFGFNDGVAIKELSQAEFKLLQNGSQLAVHINGDPPRHWSLHGSSAAILKVKECYQQRGHKPGGKASSQPTPPKTPQQSKSTGKPRPDMSTFLTSAPVTCETVFAGRYACTVEQYKPTAGYVESVRIHNPALNQPAFFLNFVSKLKADVWVKDGASAWAYMGVWVSQDRTDPCIAPRPKQGPIARGNLGQDAWQLCLY